MNRPMLTQQHFPGNVPRIQFYAHLQRPRLRCIAWTSPKKNKYYATIKFFMKHYSNATNLKPRYFRQRRLTSLWLVFPCFTSVSFLFEGQFFSSGLSTWKQAFPHSYHMVNAEPPRTTNDTSYN